MAYFADARCSMDNIQYFYAFFCNPIDNQVSVENNITIYAAFCRKVAAFGISRVVNMERI
jgi:hypothetical protein